MTDPLLPPGITVGAALTLEDEPAVRIDLSATTGDSIVLNASIVIAPRAARALGALLLRQADLVERQGAPVPLRLVGGGE